MNLICESESETAVPAIKGLTATIFFGHETPHTLGLADLLPAWNSYSVAAIG